MRVFRCLAVWLVIPSLAIAATVGGSAVISSHRAATHPMRYHLALPSGWSARTEWPVLVVIPDAHRDFKAILEQFVLARGDRPYILVAPEVLSCGGAGSRTPDHYTYSRAEWDSLQGGDDFAFEDAGLRTVLADVRKNWRGEPKAFLTGWEAGGHTVWAQAFRQPELWRGVAPVTSNYQRRGVDSKSVARGPERTSLPIQPFLCGAPTGENAQAVPYAGQQTATALRDAQEHGFRPRPVRVVPNQDHGPLPEAVLAWCDSLRGRR